MSILQRSGTIVRLALGAVVATAALSILGSAALQAAEKPIEYIAGVAPQSRPAQAPVLSSYAKPDGWYGHALSGVWWPYPASLKFLEDQQNWYTPFTRPGMTGPYDIRGWHRQ